MNKICTSPEQSQKLLELGIDVNTADMCYDGYALDNNGSHPVRLHKSDGEYDIPAWSLTALLSLSNNCDLSKERIEEDGSDDRYWFHDDNFHKFSNEYDNPLDAVFEMIVWLKENGKI